jgi:hypothetical protein
MLLVLQIERLTTRSTSGRRARPDHGPESVENCRQTPGGWLFFHVFDALAPSTIV